MHMHPTLVFLHTERMVIKLVSQGVDPITEDYLSYLSY